MRPILLHRHSGRTWHIYIYEGFLTLKLIGIKLLCNLFCTNNVLFCLMKVPMVKLLLDRLEATQKRARRRKRGTGFDGVRSRCVLLAPSVAPPLFLPPKRLVSQL